MTQLAPPHCSNSMDHHSGSKFFPQESECVVLEPNLNPYDMNWEPELQNYFPWASPDINLVKILEQLLERHLGPRYRMLHSTLNYKVP